MRRTLLILLAAGFALGLTGQASAADQQRVDPSITDGSAAREFNRARARWLRSDIDSYRMTVGRFCFCAPPRRSTVVVRRSRPVRSSVRRWTGPRTVPQMFRVIGRAIKRNAADLNVRYHRRLGIPYRASIDYIARIADDEVSYRIAKFGKLKRRH